MTPVTAYIFIACFRVSMVICNQQQQAPILNFDGEQYMQYIPSKSSIFENSFVNKLVFKFRTVHSSGILLLLSGRMLNSASGHQRNVLSIHLIHGYLCYQLTSSNKRKSSLLMDSSNLNDDQWHHVSIIRTKSLTQIQLDNQTKLHISSQTFTAFSYNDQVFIGGSGDLSKGDQITRVPNFKGCLQLLYLDGREPVTYYNQGSTRVEMHPPRSQLQYCHGNDDVKSIIGLPQISSSLVLNLQLLNLTFTKYFVIEFSMRTYSQEGTILKTNGISFGVNLEISVGKTTCQLGESILLPSEIKISDGLWHFLRIEVNQNEFQLQVDKTIHKTAIFFSSKDIMNIGNIIEFGGIVGCFDSIKIQRKVIDLFHGKHLQQRRNIRTTCTLLNQCFPSPCLNKGMCRHERTEILCDCSDTDFYGKYCEKSLYKSSCAAYQNFGLNESSYCLIDPDDSGPLLPYTNLCQMSSLKKQLATVVRHNKADSFEGANGDSKGYAMTHHIFKYELDETSLNLLIKNSQTCRQRVIFQCRQIGFKFKSPGEAPNLTWLSNGGTERFYWGDVPSNTRGCECGLSKTCIDANKLCNCDALKADWSQDEGYISNKEDLPIRRVTLRGIKEGQSKITVGPLECFGDKTATVTDESDVEEFKVGELLSKLCYSIKKKDTLLHLANQTIQVNLRREKPYVATVPLTPTTKPYSIYIISNPALPVSNILSPEDPNEQTNLSIYEIILIIIAGLSTMVLLVKFILCNIFRRLHGQVTLNHDQDRYDNPAMFTSMQPDAAGNSSSLNRNYGGINCTKTCVKSPSNYWV